MELIRNLDAPFTRWVTAERFLEQPFVLIDVGVQDGISTRWAALGDQLRVYGFDPLAEAIAPLEAANRPGHRYFAMALGDEDGERELYVQGNTTATSFYAQAPSRYEVSDTVWRSQGVRRVPIARLDTLYANGAVPRADFIKLDCEGFEPEVLKGARRFLAESPILGADMETSFNVSPILKDTHFWASYEPLLRRSLLVFDLRFNRVPRASYAERVRTARSGVAMVGGTHRPATCNFLFARDLVQERDSPDSFAQPPAPPSADEVLKTAVVLELYGLVDCAYDLLLAFEATLADRLDVRRATEILVPPTGWLGGLRLLPRRLWRAWRGFCGD